MGNRQSKGNIACSSLTLEHGIKNHSLSLEVGDISPHLDRVIFPQNP